MTLSGDSTENKDQAVQFPQEQQESNQLINGQLQQNQSISNEDKPNLDSVPQENKDPMLFPKFASQKQSKNIDHQKKLSGLLWVVAFVVVLLAAGASSIFSRTSQSIEAPSFKPHLPTYKLPMVSSSPFSLYVAIQESDMYWEAEQNAVVSDLFSKLNNFISNIEFSQYHLTRISKTQGAIRLESSVDSTASEFMKKFMEHSKNVSMEVKKHNASASYSNFKYIFFWIVSIIICLISILKLFKRRAQYIIITEVIVTIVVFSICWASSFSFENMSVKEIQSTLSNIQLNKPNVCIFISKNETKLDSNWINFYESQPQPHQISKLVQQKLQNIETNTILEAQLSASIFLNTTLEEVSFTSSIPLAITLKNEQAASSIGNQICKIQPSNTNSFKPIQFLLQSLDAHQTKSIFASLEPISTYSNDIQLPDYFEIKCGSLLFTQSIFYIPTQYFVGELSKYKPKTSNSKYNILVFGQAGAGKSTTINNIITSISDIVKTPAQSGRIGSVSHVTVTLQRVNASLYSTTDPKYIHFDLFDTWGLTKHNYDTLQLEQILRGQLKMGSKMESNRTKIVYKNETLKQRIHAIMFLITAPSILDQSMLTKIQQSYQVFAKHGYNPILVYIPLGKKIVDEEKERLNLQQHVLNVPLKNIHIASKYLVGTQKDVAVDNSYFSLLLRTLSEAREYELSVLAKKKKNK